MSELSSSFDKEWRENASCKGMTTENFFPVAITKANTDSVRSLYYLCSKCPVMPHCLHEAITSDYDGIWGHTTYKQRKAYIKYYFHNKPENITFADSQNLADEILALSIQPNSTFKKIVSSIQNTKNDNSNNTAGVSNV